MLDDRGLTPQRVVSLIMIILRELHEKRLDRNDLESISDRLIGQGFTESEINAAFSWVYYEMEGAEPAEVLFQDKLAKTSIRVLHPAEKTVIKPDAYGQLLEMHIIGLLRLEDIERLIERAMTIGSVLGKNEIQLLVHNLLFEEGFPGTSGILHLNNQSDTVH